MSKEEAADSATCSGRGNRGRGLVGACFPMTYVETPALEAGLDEIRGLLTTTAVELIVVRSAEDAREVLRATSIRPWACRRPVADTGHSRTPDGSAIRACNPG
jgi:hypothetical protein